MIKRLLIAVLMSMSALTSFAYNQEKLQTYRWGYTWKVPQYKDAGGQAVIKKGWTETIASSNTPGSCEYGSLRATMPVYYAWLDGYDTRAIGTVQDTFPYTSTNCYLRYVIADDLKERYKKLYDLECGDLGERTFWSSTAMESILDADYPTEEAFNWTKEIGTNMFVGGILTGWLPAFKGCAFQSGVSAYAYKRDYPNETRRGLFWEYILPKMSFNDPDTYDIMHRVGDNTDPCLPSFDEILAYKFGRSNEWNKVEYDLNTRRLNQKALAQQSQALSMFDRTIHIDKMPIAYTNRMTIGGWVNYQSNLTWGNVDIYGGSYGEYVCYQFDTYHSGGAIPSIDGSITKTSGITNEYSYAETYAPRVGTTKTYLDCDVAVQIQIPDGVAEAWIPTDTFLQLGLLRVFADVYDIYGVEADYLELSLHVYENEIMIYATYYPLAERHVETYVAVPDIPDGQYGTSGSAYLYGWYQANATALPRLPYRNDPERYEIYPDATVFCPQSAPYPYKKLHFMSFAKVNDYKEFWDDINFNDGEGRDWNNMTNYGYKCYIDRYHNYGQGEYITPLALLEMLCQIDAKIYHPDEWTGLSQSDFRAWLGSPNTEYTLRDEVKYHNDENGQLGSIIVKAYLESDQNVILFDNEWNEIHNFMGAKRFLSGTVRYPIHEGVTYRKTASSTITRLNSVTEATWGFPEVTTANEVFAPDIIETKTGWYYVRFDPNDSGAYVNPTKKLVWVGDAYGELPTPQHYDESKAFLGWFTDSIGGYMIDAYTIVPECGKPILYAHWKTAALITYDANGGVVVPEQEYCHDHVILPRPSRAGYDFKGWYYERGAGQRAGGAGDEFSCNLDMTLYAHWEERE